MATDERRSTMRAVVRERYGIDALEVREVEQPRLADDGVLVRVRACSLNRGDWYALTGTPYLGRPPMGLLRPKSPLLGGDFAGTVEAVGPDVVGLRAGDEVFGVRSGALAEYVCVRVGVAEKPASLTFEEAAAVPVAAVTALQGLRDKGGLRPRQRVLVNGASGGVGTFAVQIAKALGGEVTGVCGTRNVELVRSLGADRVIDYTHEDFTRGGGRYDLMLDVAGSRSWRECRRVLAPDATVVVVGGPMRSRLFGPLAHVGGMLAAGLGGRRRVAFYIAKPNRPDLDTLRELVDSGQVRPVVERRYELGEIRDALAQLGTGHLRGKLVVTL